MSVTTPTPPGPPPVPPAPPAPSAGTLPPPPAGPAGASTAIRVGAVITGLLIVLGALNLFQLTVGRDHSSAHYAYSTSASTLVLDSDSADITVETGAAGALSVERNGSTAHGRTFGSPSFDGRVLNLPGDCHGGPWGWLTFCSVHYVVRVPAGLDLTVRTGSGDIDVPALSATVLRVKTGSGDLELGGVRASALTASTGSGDIDGPGLVGADTSVDTGSGDVKLTFAQAPTTVKASTGSGDLTVMVPRDSTPYTVHEHNGSGDFTNHLLSSDQATSATPRVLTVSTGSGDLTLGYAG